jgi:hypothetical protein
MRSAAAESVVHVLQLFDNMQSLLPEPKEKYWQGEPSAGSFSTAHRAWQAAH